MNTSVIIGSIMLAFVLIGGFMGMKGQMNKLAGPVPDKEVQTEKKLPKKGTKLQKDKAKSEKRPSSTNTNKPASPPGGSCENTLSEG